MVSSRWQKLNTSLLYIGPAIIIVIYMSVGSFVRSLGLNRGWLNLLITVLVTAVAIAIAFIVMKLRAKSMTRVLKMETETAVFALRKMLKDNHIHYNRQVEGDLSRFDFPGQSLTMDVQPYFLHNFVFTPKKNPQPATLITLSKLDASNKQFANTLAVTIDEMINQQPNNWSKA